MVSKKEQLVIFYTVIIAFFYLRLVACHHQNIVVQTPKQVVSQGQKKISSPVKVSLNDHYVSKRYNVLAKKEVKKGSLSKNISLSPKKLVSLPKKVLPKKDPKIAYSYTVNGHEYHVLRSAKNYRKTGKASWYGEAFHGRLTSNGEVFNMYKLTAANKELPLSTYIKVTNLANKKHIVVKVNDRGPFIKGRILDLSYAAAKKLDFIKNGVTLVRIEALNTKIEPQLKSNKIKPVLACR